MLWVEEKSRNQETTKNHRMLWVEEKKREENKPSKPSRPSRPPLQTSQEPRDRPPAWPASPPPPGGPQRSARSPPPIANTPKPPPDHGNHHISKHRYFLMIRRRRWQNEGYRSVAWTSNNHIDILNIIISNNHISYTPPIAIAIWRIPKGGQKVAV